jgi:hypothetical protein
MNQPKIHIVEDNGKDWGIYDVKAVFWDVKNTITSIRIDFIEHPFYSHTYFYNQYNGTFKNSHGNLIGNLIVKLKEEL